jgi:hypothetical protein
MQAPIHIDYPAGLTAVHFILLRLARGNDVVCSNFYWRGVEEGNSQSLRTLPKATVHAATSVERVDRRWRLITTLHNTSATPALMVHVKAVREKSGDRVLPALYSDNYIALMPGEWRTIHTEVDDADTHGETPRIAMEGFNVIAR